jgi:hypothetical protein
MRGAADEIHRAIAQRRIGLVDGKDQLELDIEPLLLEAAELDRGDRGEIGVRDHIGHGEFHGLMSPAAPFRTRADRAFQARTVE